LRLTPPTEGFPWDDLHKFFYRKVRDGEREGTEWSRNIAENFNRLSRVHERYKTTDRETTEVDIIGRVGTF